MDNIRQLKQQLNNASSYEQWQAIARLIDQQSGGLEWQDNEKADEHPTALFKTHTAKLKTLFKKQDWGALTAFLQESLSRTVGELNNPLLYQPALCGTKRSIEVYLDTVVDAINAVCDHPLPNFSGIEKLALFQRAERNFGRPALMLSGGGTFGIYHVGVIHALLDADLLPDIICGTSMGSIAAGILAVKTEQELADILAHPEQQHYKPLKRLPVKEAIKQKSLLDPEQLQECIHANIGDVTFEEAYQKTGREVSITVSPAEAGQKPRILNHQTAPEVLISAASKASCSVPGLFPPTELKAKNSKGRIVPYLPNERWVDGSFASDIPRQRISRLHNVNFFIVSQANPHVLPFVAQRQKSGLTALVKDVAISSLVGQGNTLLKVAQRRQSRQPWRSWLDHAAILLDQDYLGDINIHPELPASWYTKFMKNPNQQELEFLLHLGKQATWPQLAMIKDQTRISKTLRDCIDKLATLTSRKYPAEKQTQQINE